MRDKEVLAEIQRDMGIPAMYDEPFDMEVEDSNGVGDEDWEDENDEELTAEMSRLLRTQTNTPQSRVDYRLRRDRTQKMLDAWTGMYPELVEVFMEWDRSGAPNDDDEDSEVGEQSIGGHDVIVTAIDITGELSFQAYAFR